MRLCCPSHLSLVLIAGHKLCMLGYGNMAALVNDPRVIAEDVGGPADSEGGQQQQLLLEPPRPEANCAVGWGASWR